MKALILVVALALTASACIPPVQPLAPLGCTSGHAILVTQADGTCYWTWVGCNE